MITLTKQEAQQVLDALEVEHSAIYGTSQTAKAIEIFRAKLSEPEIQPVAWMWDVYNGAGYSSRGIGFQQTDIPFAKHTPLYTTPPQRDKGQKCHSD